MDDRGRYETVKSRLKAMGQGTAQQVHDAIEPSPYSVREVENTLDEMALAEQDEFEKIGDVIAGKNTIGSVWSIRPRDPTKSRSRWPSIFQNEITTSNATRT